MKRLKSVGMRVKTLKSVGRCFNSVICGTEKSWVWLYEWGGLLTVFAKKHYLRTEIINKYL